MKECILCLLLPKFTHFLHRVDHTNTCLTGYVDGYPVFFQNGLDSARSMALLSYLDDGVYLSPSQTEWLTADLVVRHASLSPNHVQISTLCVCVCVMSWYSQKHLVVLACLAPTT